jgi:hypothetical protein
MKDRFCEKCGNQYDDVHNYPLMCGCGCHEVEIKYPEMKGKLEVLRLAEQLKNPMIFWDKGWGDVGDSLQISLIDDGNGQKPFCFLTRETFDEIQKDGLLHNNSYIGFKARRIYDFKK